MDNDKSSKPNSASNSPRANRAKSEDKTDVISSDDSITVVEINRDDSVKVSNDNINDKGELTECSNAMESNPYCVITVIEQGPVQGLSLVLRQCIHMPNATHIGCTGSTDEVSTVLGPSLTVLD